MIYLLGYFVLLGLAVAVAWVIAVFDDVTDAADRISWHDPEDEP